MPDSLITVYRTADLLHIFGSKVRQQQNSGYEYEGGEHDKVGSKSCVNNFTAIKLHRVVMLAVSTSFLLNL